MNYTIKKDDLYSLIKPDLSAMDKDNCNKLREKVMHESASSSKYVIVNIEGVKECNAEGIREMIRLGVDLRDQGGMLLITHADLNFSRLFNKADLTFIPTDIEAIDFVFMDHLEKQFTGMDDSDNHGH